MTGSNQSKLLYKLCAHLSGSDKGTSLIHLFSQANQVLSKTSVSTGAAQNELVITERIQKTILTACGEEDSLAFLELHRKLQSLPVPRRRSEVLCLLLCLSDLPATVQGLQGSLLEMPQNAIPRMETHSLHCKESTWESNWENNNASNNGIVNSTGARRVCSYDTPRGQLYEAKEQNGHIITSSKLHSPVIKSYPTLAAYTQQVSEHTLIQELLYSFQGIEGKVLRIDVATGGFYINPKVHLFRPQRGIVERLVELGWLYNKLKRLSEESKSRPSGEGLITQALNSVVTDEITELYRILAILQSQLHQQSERTLEAESPMSEGVSRGSSGSRNSLNQPSLSLLQLQVHMSEPLQRMRWLVDIYKACQEKKGGALASTVHGFLQHGNPFVRNIVHTLLVAVCKPLYVMLSRWILDGELEDPFNEFFIQVNPSVGSDDQLWHKKYKVRHSMVPSFISVAQAQRILATGKSINFLQQVCEDLSPVNSREMLRRALENSSGEAMFLLDRHSDLQSLMDKTFLEISRRVLDVLNSKYKFMEHLQALRRYLLLGQGDFIRHLMELLEPELHKPASELYTHSMCDILETAVRSTNAQFEDSSILQRLDVYLLEHSPGDTGWTVFSLSYNVQGPISTVFSSSKISYLLLFNALWKAKRIEWVLSQMWKRLTTSAKMLPKIPELSPVLQQTYLLSAEMIHLVHQLQYYFLFEVMECSWDKLISNVQQADGLDDVIKAHHIFLERIKAGALVDDASQELGHILRSVYELVLTLRSYEETLHARVIKEIQFRVEYEKHVEEHGTNAEFESQYLQASQDFVDDFLNSMRRNLKLLAESYHSVVKKFLLMLASHPDMSLQLLSSRLDFNDHYKRHDGRLSGLLTYQHRRKSEVFVPSSSVMSGARVPSEQV